MIKIVSCGQTFKRFEIMQFKIKLLIPVFCFLISYSLSAQYGPRLFLDAPGIYFTAPSVEDFNKNMGLGADVNMNIGTHNTVVRFGGGSRFTVDPKAAEIQNAYLTTPFVKLEAGAGRYRSNGNKCAKTHRPAFTAMAKAGVRYNFLTPKNRPEGTDKGELDYNLGLEFGYFYIRDIIKNYEVFATGDYYLKSKTVAAEAGLRIFFNLRGRRD